MLPVGYYKTMEQIRDAFASFCQREGVDQSEKNFAAYLHGLRLLKFTLL